MLGTSIRGLVERCAIPFKMHSYCSGLIRVRPVCHFRSEFVTNSFSAIPLNVLGCCDISLQMTAHRAFQFCLQYKRTTEFRRLCEILRNHLTNLNKYRDQRDRPDLTQPESLQLYLETRFEQLKIATELELWQVGIGISTRT